LRRRARKLRRRAKNMTKLQVALDLTDFDKAILIAGKSVYSGVDILEIGTPLLKAYGVFIIRLFREIFPNTVILADAKTIDAGRIEAETVFRSGADMMTLLGLAEDETILDALSIAERYGGEIVVDTINIDDIEKRVGEIVDLGIKNICLHIGVDVQRRRGIDISILLNEAAKLKKMYSDIRIFLAGGINPKNLPLIMKIKPDVVVVGGYILRSKDPVKAVREIKNILGDRQ